MLGLATSLLLIPLCPIPMHGGLNFLGLMAYEELTDRVQESNTADKTQTAKRPVKHSSHRFTEALDITGAIALAGSWSQVHSGYGSVFYDADSGMFWSAVLQVQSASPLSELERFKGICRQLEPQGTWTLPTEVEQYYFWKAGGAGVLPDGGASAISVLIDRDMGLELAVINKGVQGGNRHTSRATASYPLRCVARGHQAPPGGYVKGDISLEEWNRYQMSKLY